MIDFEDLLKNKLGKLIIVALATLVLVTNIIYYVPLTNTVINYWSEVLEKVK